MKVWTSIIMKGDGTLDVETLDQEPTVEFWKSILNAYGRGADFEREDPYIVWAEIREGNINGGDSVHVAGIGRDHFVRA